MGHHVAKSRVKERIAAGDWVFGASVMPEVWHIDLLGALGFDFAWIDGEHGSLDDSQVAALCLAARGAGYDPIVRIRKENVSDIYRALEAGAAGVIVPHCDTVEEARTAVLYGKFAPVGERSFGGVGVDAKAGLVGVTDYLAEANAHTLLILQIETPKAVEAVGEIAALDGVDGIMVGPADLSVALGNPLDFRTNAFQKCLERVAEACDTAGKWWGMPPGGTDMAEHIIAMGAKFICYGSPRRVVLAGYEALKREFDALRAGR